MASFAGAKSGLLRTIGIKEELNILRLRTPRWAGRAAINASRADAVKQRAVKAAVAGDNCVPKLCGIVGCDRCGSHVSKHRIARFEVLSVFSQQSVRRIKPCSTCFWSG